MADKYLANVSGQPAMVEATVSSAGAGNAGDIVALDTDGKLNASIMPTGIGADVEAVVASEALSAGDMVNFWNDLGTRKVRLADCSNGRRAHGFVLAAVSSGAGATVYKKGTITGLTIAAGDVGLPYFLSTAGGNTKTPVTTAGQISQEIGVSVSTSSISFEAQQPITLA